jgi:glycosyltransferase involved in cell wall biosynthesis
MKNVRIILFSGPLKLSGSVTWLKNLYQGFYDMECDVVHIVMGKEVSNRLPEHYNIYYTGAIERKFPLRLLRLFKLHKLRPQWYSHFFEHIIANELSKILSQIGWSQCDLLIKDYTTHLPVFFTKFNVVSVVHQLLKKNWLTSSRIRSKSKQAVNSYVAVSHEAAKQAEFVGINIKKVISNPLDIDSIKVLSTEHIEIEPDIIFVGRLKKDKGVFSLLEAFSLLDKDRTLCYVGSGSELYSLKKLATKLNVLTRVKFVGFQENPYPYIAKAKLLILPSNSEAMGYVLIEAEVLDTQVLLSDFSASTEFFNPNVIVSLQPTKSFSLRLAEKIKSIEDKKENALLDGIIENMVPKKVACEYMIFIHQKD